MARSYAGCRTIVSAALIGLGGAAQALEGGNNGHPDGVETVASGILPDPGVTTFVYTQFYTASRLNDGSGRKALPKFDLNVYAVTLRPFYVMPTDLLGGAHVAFSAAIPIINGSLTLPFGRGSDTNLGDVALQGHIGWHGETFHHAFQLTVLAPTGAYDRLSFFNIGANVWNYSLDYAFTWFTPLPGIEVSAQTGLIGYGRNDATGYQNGVSGFSDFGINYHPDRHWVLGLGGYGAFQLSDDTQFGLKVGPDGARSSAFALGPQVGYNAGPWAVLAKWQREVYARNRPEGDRFWLQGFVRF